MTRRASHRIGGTGRRGYFGVAVWHPKSESNVGSLLRTAVSYEAAMLATVGRRYRQQSSDTTKARLHTPLLHFVDIDDLVDHLPVGCSLIGVELDDRAVDLAAYAHPVRALYLLGAEDHGLPPEVLARCHDVVQIRTALTFSLNVSVAGGIVLADRFTKSCRPHVMSA